GDEVRVQYAQGRCDGFPSGWNVPAGTVLMFRVQFGQPRSFSELHLDETKYLKGIDDTLTTYYSSRTEGVQFIVTLEAKLERVIYFPSNINSGLRCACFAKLDESVVRTMAWDFFYFKTIDAAQPRLDRFANAVSKTTFRAYVITYGGKQANPTKTAEDMQ